MRVIIRLCPVAVKQGVGAQGKEAADREESVKDWSRVKVFWDLSF